MRAFEYLSPTNKEQVATLLGERGSILAGGTDLLALMKDDVVAPQRLVNIKQIDQLRGISYQPGNGLRIGALTTIAEVSEDANVQRYYPVLTDAANEAASPQIRNLATIGGNMCQRPRCWYFRNGMGLMAKTPDGKSMVRRGRQSICRDSWQRRASLLCQPVNACAGAHRPGREDPSVLCEGRGQRRARVAAGKVLRHSEVRERTRARPETRRDGD